MKLSTTFRLSVGGTAIVAAAIGAVSTAQPAHADQHWPMTPVHTQTWLQPYGGCDEAMGYVNSEGAADCRAHGWTVTRHIVVSPKGYVRAIDMPHCNYEDGSGGSLPCYWNGSVAGNGEGRSYWISPNGRTHYVRGLA